MTENYVVLYNQMGGAYVRPASEFTAERLVVLMDNGDATVWETEVEARLHVERVEQGRRARVRRMQADLRA